MRSFERKYFTMQAKKWLIPVIGILAVGIAITFLNLHNSKDSIREKSVEVSTNLVNGMVYGPGTHTFSLKDVHKIKIQNHNGNTFIKQAVQKEVVIDAAVSQNGTEKKQPEFEISQKGKELSIEVIDKGELNLTITIPVDLKEIDSQSSFGNIRGDLVETNFIRFVTYFGNLISEFEIVNPKGEYIYLTNVGEIVTVVPEGTELSYQNQSISGNTLLTGVKENKKAVKFITTVRDVGWIPPHFIGNESLQQLSKHTDPTPITKQQIEEDLEFTIMQMTDLHPHVKMEPSFYEPLFQRARQNIQQATTREDLFIELNKLMVATKDGHTLAYYANNQISFPVLKWINDNELIVLEDLEPFKQGDKILSIGDKDVHFIMEAARSSIPAEHEGYIKASINSFLRKPVFLQHYDMLSEIGETRVVYDRNGVKQSTTLKAEGLTGMSLDRLFNNQVRNPYEWSIDSEGKYGIFKIDESIPTAIYTVMLKEFFTDIKKKNVPNLFVDLRNGGGGNGMVAFEFLSYLNIDSYSNGSGMIQNSKSPDDLLYNGNVYVLTSYQTFSAGTDFAKIIQGNGIGRLVGESPGNNASYGGNISQFNLSNSGIYVQLPTTLNPAPVPADEQFKPLQVDYPVEVTRESILNNKDMWLEKIKEIVSND
jgi:hypothetical protein